MTQPGKTLRDGVGRPLMTALALIGLTIAGFGVWFWTAPVSSAVIAEGRFRIDGNVKTLQHLEGGIVTELLVKDGDRVAAGDVLLRLDVTDSLAIHASLAADRDALMARRVRLEAELDDADAPDFAALTNGNQPVSNAAVASQSTLFEARQEERLARSEMLEGTLTRLDTRHDAQIAELQSLKAQLRLVTEDTDAARQLAGSGLVTRLNLNERERQLASLTGAVASVTAGIAETEAARNEARLDHARQQTEYISAISKELAEVSAGLAELEPRIGAEAERIRRSDVTAPMAGTVVDLKLATIGGVLAPGEPVLDIVPSDGTLIAEARLAPAARERMRVGMPVELRLPGVRARKERGLDGEITLISAEITEDPDRTAEGNEPSYEVRIALNEIPDDIHIEPGMPVTSVIATDARTALDYLISPMTDAIARSMREQQTMSRSSKKTHAPGPGRPDRREIAQDLFREHLDLDRITRVTKALHADGKPERREHPSFLSARNDTDIHPPCGSSISTSVAATLPPAQRTTGETGTRGSHPGAVSQRGSFLRVMAVLALVIPSVVVPDGVHDGQRSLFPVGEDIATIDTAAPPRPLIPSVLTMGSLEPRRFQSQDMRDRATQSVRPVIPVQFLEMQPVATASVAVRTPVLDESLVRLASFTPTYEPVRNGVTADQAPTVPLRSPAAGVLESEPVLPSVPNRPQKQAAWMDTPDTFHDRNVIRRILPTRVASVPALPLVDDMNSSAPLVRRASLFGEERPSLTRIITASIVVDTGFPGIGAPVELPRPRARPDLVGLSPAPETAAGPGPARIVIHYNSVNSGRMRADGLAQQLSANRIGSVELRSVGFDISRDNIRYFFPADSSVARRVGGVMINSGVTIRDFSTFRPSPRRGTIEIWLSS